VAVIVGDHNGSSMLNIVKVVLLCVCDESLWQHVSRNASMGSQSMAASWPSIPTPAGSPVGLVAVWANDHLAAGIHSRRRCSAFGSGCHRALCRRTDLVPPVDRQMRRKITNLQ
jgi:hypothetical protein